MTIPMISTRGYYDLKDGSTIKQGSYFLYPKREFEKITGVKEIVIMVHGLRNNRAGALAKAHLAKKRLNKIRYRNPVVGYSYDSNIKGAHLAKHAKRVLMAGQKIAKKNGRHLAMFIHEFKKKNPKTKIRLLGHSLGSQVILSTIEQLARKRENSGIIESVHFFGASIPRDTPSSKKYGKMLDMVVSKKIVNCYYPKDEVLGWAKNHRFVDGPLGLCGASGKSISKYSEKKVWPENHRFASYVATLSAFP